MSEHKRKIEEVLRDYQTNNNETRDGFLKKIQINYSTKISDSEITTFRRHFQILLAIFGLSPKVYACLMQTTPLTTFSSEDLTNSFKQLLTAWIDSRKGKDTDKQQKIIERMAPLVYE